MKAENIVTFLLRIPKNMQEEARRYADAEYHSLNQWILQLIDQALIKRRADGNAPAGLKSVPVEPGLEVVKQKRGKRGRFQKREDK